MSKLKSIVDQLSGQEYEMEFSETHLSSMTFGHSTPDTQDSLLEKWIGSLPDSHANHSQLPVISLARPMNETSGQKQGTPFASYDRDMSCWKTYQVSLLTDTLDEFSGTWPKTGTIVNGILSGRLTVVQGTSGRDSGLWPTPDAGVQTRFNQSDSPGAAKRPTLALAVRMFPTPEALNQEGYQMSGGKKYLRLGAMVNPTKDGGRLNPCWVEWLMNWPLGLTSLEPISILGFKLWRSLNENKKRRTSGSPKKVQGDKMYCMWFDKEPGTTSQGRQPKQQRTEQCSGPLSKTSYQNSSRVGGPCFCPASGMCSMQQEVPAQADSQLNGLFNSVSFKAWEDERRQKVGRSQNEKEMCLLWQGIHFQETERNDLFSELWEQARMEEAHRGKEPMIPRLTSKTTNRANRLKTIGNGWDGGMVPGILEVRE